MRKHFPFPVGMNKKADYYGPRPTLDIVAHKRRSQGSRNGKDWKLGPVLSAAAAIGNGQMTPRTKKINFPSLQPRKGSSEQTVGENGSGR